MATAADLQTAVDALTTAVTVVQAEIAALKAAPALISQAQLDANTATVSAAASALNPFPGTSAA